MTDTADAPLDSSLVVVQRLKILLVARATGRDVEGNDEEYQQLRSRLVASPFSGRLPDVVRAYRTLSEFWMFIQPAFRSYDERRKFLKEEFEPLLSWLEGIVPLRKFRSPEQTGQEEMGAFRKGSTDRKVVLVVYGRNGFARARPAMLLDEANGS